VWVVVATVAWAWLVEGSGLGGEGFAVLAEAGGLCGLICGWSVVRLTGVSTGKVTGWKNSIVKSGSLRTGSSKNFKGHNDKAATCKSNTATEVTATTGADGLSFVTLARRMGLAITYGRWMLAAPRSWAT
jgi:hypothetical protein